MRGAFTATALALSVLGLTACDGSSSGTDPVVDSAAPTSKSLGLIRITVDGIGTPNPSATAETVGDPSSGPTSKALTAQPCFLQIQSPAVSSGAFSAGGQQYVSFTFKVRNAQGTSYTAGNTTCTNGTANPNSISNITLTGIVEPGYGINNTPFLKLAKFDGTNADPSLATTILPTHGMTFDAINNVPAVAIGQESLQVLTESQIAAVAVDPEAASGSYLMPYAYMVRNVDPTKGRTLPANPAAGQYDGEFTYAVKLPVSGSKTNAIYSFTIDLQAVTDSVTRVTQSAEEQTALGDVAANIRALTLGSTDLAVLGGSHVTSTNNGDPICSVRIAGPSSSPMAYLTTNNTSANVASAPYNLQSLSNATTVNAGFCSPMTTPQGIYSQFVVTGSQSGQRTVAGSYGGSYLGGGTSQLSFIPTASRPFFTGETVSYSLTNALTNSNGSHPAPFVGSFNVGGTVPSSGSMVPRMTTAIGSAPNAAVMGDFDGDGNLDVATANVSSNTVTILLGNGDGTYHAASGSPISVGNSPYAVVAADLNLDGKLDLVIADRDDNNIKVLLGAGNGTFTATSNSPATGAGPQAIYVGDFNGDGKPDMVVANTSADTVTILLGNGAGTFTAAAGSPVAVGDGPVAIIGGDFNSDGKLDFATANANAGTVSIMFGSGSGGFTAASGSPITIGSTVLDIESADINGDNKPDLVVINYGNSSASILLNNGSGGFTAASGSPIAVTTNPYHAAISDFNADGKLDIAVTNSSGNVSILLGSGNGAFTSAAYPPTGVASGQRTIVAGDLNGDGRPDLVIPNYATSSLVTLLGNGGGSFSAPLLPVTPQTTLTTGSRPAQSVAADFNGDGLLDVAAVNATSGTVSVFLSQGGGKFVTASGSPFTVGTNPQGIAVGDFNGDGKIDIATANFGGANVSILPGNGTGGFGAASSVTVGTKPYGIISADFNGDGKADLAVTNFGDNTVSILLGNGSYGFTAATAVTVGTQPEGVTTADFNGDGKPDLMVANYNDNSISVLLGNGAGSFTGATITNIPTPSGSGSLVTGDFNGDGKMDAALSSYTASSFVRLLGDGNGGFSVSTIGTNSDNSSQIAAGDFNGDGRLDIAVTNSAGNYLTIFTADASGGFSSAKVSVGSGPLGVIAGDFYGAHKLGLAIANSGENTLSIVPQK